MVVKKELVKVLIEEIKPYERNNKIHMENVDAIADGIRRNTYVSPIVVDEDNLIICGHRWRLSLKL